MTEKQTETKLSTLKVAMDKTLAAGATPHRDLHWEMLDLDTVVAPELAFVETFNTGYPGVLNRYLFEYQGELGMIDLLPGLIGGAK